MSGVDVHRWVHLPLATPCALVTKWQAEWDSPTWTMEAPMTAQRLMIAGTVLGVVAVILFVLGQSTLGVVFILLAGLAWTLTQYRRAPSGREDDRPSASGP